MPDLMALGIIILLITKDYLLLDFNLIIMEKEKSSRLFLKTAFFLRIPSLFKRGYFLITYPNLRGNNKNQGPSFSSINDLKGLMSFEKEAFMLYPQKDTLFLKESSRSGDTAIFEQLLLTGNQKGPLIDSKMDDFSKYYYQSKHEDKKTNGFNIVKRCIYLGSYKDFFETKDNPYLLSLGVVKINKKVNHYFYFRKEENSNLIYVCKDVQKIRNENKNTLTNQYPLSFSRNGLSKFQSSFVKILLNSSMILDLIDDAKECQEEHPSKISIYFIQSDSRIY